jgi:phosphoribosylformimino-5-aminoimidazole carboxamide ribotide isomerase
MLLLPVIDLCGGLVVRAIAGRRAEYRPLVSRLTDSTDPLAVARAIRERFAWTEFYLADLDAIGASEPAFPTYRRLHADGFRLWVDAGVRDRADAQRLATAGVDQMVVGLETVRGPAEWRAILRNLGPERVVFSLDLRDGRPMAPPEVWGTTDPGRIVERVVADGGRRVIVLDVARVGTGGGTGTEAVCADLVRRHPEVAVYVGGGVRGTEDVQRLREVGVAGVLLASALHDGSFDPSV